MIDFIKASTLHPVEHSSAMNYFPVFREFRLTLFSASLLAVYSALVHMPIETEVNGMFLKFPYILVMPTETMSTDDSLLAFKYTAPVAVPGKLVPLLI